MTAQSPGTLREVVKISLPLMLAVASGSLMMFADRLILSYFSVAAMNAAVAMGMTAALFQFGAINIASITEVFVGRCNGAKMTHRCAEAAHQMLYFSLFSAAIFLPVAWLGPLWLVPGNLLAAGGQHYFRILMLFGPLFPATAALSSYFVGLGKVRAVTWAMILGNGTNVAIDLALIPKLGCTGAAIATGIAQGIQLLILGALFLRRHQRHTYGTAKARFRPRLFLDCLRVGTPSAAGHMIEIACWTIGVQMITRAGADYLAIYSVGQSFFVLFSFTSEGLQKGISSLASNYIGAKRYDLAQRSVRSGAKLVLIMGTLLALPLLLFPEQLTLLFLHGQDPLVVLVYARVACFCLWLFFLADSMVWVLAAVLTAGGDTKFVMWMNGLAAALFSGVPTYLAYFVLHCSPGAVWIMAVLYATVNCTCFFLRYRTGRWQRIAITSTEKIYASAP